MRLLKFIGGVLVILGASGFFPAVMHSSAMPASQVEMPERQPDYDENATSTAGFMTDSGTLAINVLAPGDILAQWPTGDTLNWGVGFDKTVRTVWINDNLAGGGSGLNEEFTLGGARTGASFLPDFGETWPGDMAYNTNTGMFWQVNVGGDNCIYEWDASIPEATGNIICGPAWTATSQRGLAWDPTDDSFFIGGWNEYIIYHVAYDGSIIEQWDTGIAISGLAYNWDSGQLFIIENSPTDTISQFDVASGTMVSSFSVPGFGDHAGAGLGIDCDGNLWAVNQGDNNAYLIDSSVPASLCTQAYAFNLHTYTMIRFPDVGSPGNVAAVGSTGDAGYFAGDFLGRDFSTIYAIDYNTNQLYAVSTANASATLIGSSIPAAGESWTGMTGAVNGIMYAASTDCTSSSLYTLDVNSGAPTPIGVITNGPCIIDIAINAAGELYGVDIVNDELVKINPANAAGTVIGSLGIDANYAQGLDFDDLSGDLYWAAYHVLSDTSTQGEMRIIDTSTGASTLVGMFPDGDEMDGLAFAFFGGDTYPPTIANIHESADPINRSGCTGPTTVAVRADITDASGLNWARLYYQPPGGSWTYAAMSFESGSTYMANIGPFSQAGTANYYVRAQDTAGNENQSNTDTITVNDCSLATPNLYAISNADGDGSYTVDWSDVAQADSYTLQEADNASFNNTVDIYTGSASQYSVSGRIPGTWYYRVRAVNAGGTSSWSNIQSVYVNPEAVFAVFLSGVVRNYDPYWEIEDNDSYNQANGPLVSGRFYRGYPDDLKDYFFFDSSSYGDITIDLFNHANKDVQLLLYYGRPLQSGDEVARDTKAPYHINYKGPSGRYYVYIYSVGSGFNTTIPYTLQVRYP